MLQPEECCLVVVDVQGKLAQLMQDKEKLFGNIRTLIKAAGVLEIPVVWCQQCPESLGETVDEIGELLKNCRPIDKASFSCCGEEAFNEELRSAGRPQILLCGIEAHVCIYQTAMDLRRQGWYPYVVVDAISSRTQENKDIAVRRMQSEKIKLTTIEMSLFELLRSAEHPHFKEIARLVK